jgi:hypothetical protein
MKFDPSLWFTNRIVKFIPKHFVKTNAPITSQSTYWVESKLCGRYAIGKSMVAMAAHPYGEMLQHLVLSFYFEDSKEAMLYELMWSEK